HGLRKQPNHGKAEYPQHDKWKYNFNLSHTDSFEIYFLFTAKLKFILLGLFPKIPLIKPS
ncbi:MAG: hypothetical protein IKY98_03790, partial [Alphaproteobacteria bacterium]|nr:hypothetical protein [Alphaproteobacteria bacterium]